MWLFLVKRGGKVIMEFTKSGEELTLEAIRELESDLGIRFTDLFTRFLLENNGGYPERSIFRISSNQGSSVLNRFFSTKELGKYIDILESRMPDDFIPIANDPAGNIVCLGTKNEYYESIYFWDHEQENDQADMSNMYFLSKNIYEFVNNLFETDWDDE
jgi:hypothetical protein